MGFAEECEQKCILCEAVYGGMSHFFITRIGEVREPFFDGAVGCQNEAFLFVTVVGDEVEKELDGIEITWWIAEFVNNDEIEFSEAFEEFGVFVGFGITQGLDEVRESVEGDFFEAFARLNAESNGAVGFARAGLAIEEEVVAVVDELAFSEIGHSHRGWGLNFREIEIGEHFEFWKVCLFDVALDGEDIAAFNFAFKQFEQKVTLFTFFTLNGLDKWLPQS